MRHSIHYHRLTVYFRDVLGREMFTRHTNAGTLTNVFHLLPQKKKNVGSLAPYICLLTEKKKDQRVRNTSVWVYYKEKKLFSLATACLFL